MRQKKRLMLWGSGGAAPVPTPFTNTYSTSYDGVDDYVTTGTLSSLVDGKSKLSFSVWLKLPNASETNRITGKYVGLNKWLAISCATNQVYYIVSGVSTLPSESLAYGVTGSVLTNNTWVHIVCVFDGTQGVNNDRVKIYLNGNDEVLTYNANFPSATYDFSLEGSPPNWDLGRAGLSPTSDELRGNIDEYAIYSDVALTSENVTEIYNSGSPVNLNNLTSPAPDLWYRMGDSATFNDALNWEIPDQLKIDNFSSHSFDFDGVDDYVATGLNLSYLTYPNVTFSVWIKLSDKSNLSTFTSYNPIGAYVGVFPNCTPIRIYTDGSKVAYVAIQGQGGTTYSTTDLADGNWHSVVQTCEYDAGGSINNVYIDGVKEITDKLFLSFAPITGDLIIGAQTATNWRFLGNVDDVAIFNTSKSAAEVSTIYNSGVPTDLSAETGLVGYWRMGEGITNWNGTNWQLPDYSKNALFSQKSFNFDGVDDHFRLGASLISLGLTPIISISIWAKMAGAFAGNKALITNDQSGGSLRNWTLFLTYNQLKFQVWNTDGSFNFVTDPTSLRIQDGNWHHILATFDGTTNADGIKLWVDGVVVQTGTATSTGIRTSGASTFIGGAGWNGLSWNWDGNLDEVSTWSEVKVPNDVRDSVTAIPIDLSGKSGLHSWTRMGDKGVWTILWTLPDESENNYEAFSQNMVETDLEFNTPTNLSAGLSSGMAVNDKINNAPDNENQGISVNMDLVDRVTDVP